MKARDIFPIIESIAPLVFREDWDNPGYQVGNLDREVKKIGVTHEWVMHGPSLVKNAIDDGCDLLLGHHPVFQGPQLKFPFYLGGSLVDARQDARGKTILEICRLVGNSGVCIYSSHTPWDKSEGGTRDSFATTLGINPILVGEPNKFRIGPVKPITLSDFTKFAAQALQTNIMYCHGPDDKIIKTLAAQGGGGLGDLVPGRNPTCISDLLPPKRTDIDCIIGSNASAQSKAYMRIHHPDIGYVEVHHSASERQGMHNMVKLLKTLLPSDITYTYIREPSPIYTASDSQTTTPY